MIYRGKIAIFDKNERQHWCYKVVRFCSQFLSQQTIGFKKLKFASLRAKREIYQIYSIFIG